MTVAMLGIILAVALTTAGCTPSGTPSGKPLKTPGGTSNSEGPPAVGGWVYQLQEYQGDGLDELARAPQRLAVIDLARDAKSDFFRPEEIASLRASGKKVLAYFEIGSIEQFSDGTNLLLDTRYRPILRRLFE